MSPDGRGTKPPGADRPLHPLPEAVGYGGADKAVLGLDWDRWARSSDAGLEGLLDAHVEQAEG